jgi:hypothetical protein
MNFFHHKDLGNHLLQLCPKVVYAHNMYKDQPKKKIKRKEFLLRTAHDLVTPFVTQRYKLPTIPRNIKTASHEDYEAITRKRGRFHVCSRSKDVKTQFVCKGCGHYICKDHMSMTVTCDTCKNKDETDASE